MLLCHITFKGFVVPYATDAVRYAWQLCIALHICEDASMLPENTYYKGHFCSLNLQAEAAKVAFEYVQKSENVLWQQPYMQHCGGGCTSRAAVPVG